MNNESQLLKSLKTRWIAFKAKMFTKANFSVPMDMFSVDEC